MASPNPGLLAALLKTGRLTGVLRWKVNLTKENLQTEAKIAGWLSHYLNILDAKSLADCLAVLSTEFSLTPLTLENVVSDLVKFANQGKVKSDQQVILALSGWQEFVKNNPADAANFASVLDEVAEKLPGLVLVIDSKGEFPEVAQLTSA